MKFERKTDFSQFGKVFQENLCQLILYDRSFCDQMEEVLDINFLELKYLQAFVRKIFNYREKYKLHPSIEILTTILRAELDNENEAVQKQIRDYFARMLKTEVQDEQYIKDTAIDFCKKQVLKGAILKSVPLLERSSFEEVQALINDAMVLGNDNDCGYHYLKDFEKRFEMHFRKPVTTGWKFIDDICTGGLGRGELGVVIAPTGAGKSMALVHIGSAAIKDEKSVVHYTLELQDTVVACRYDSCITGIPLKDVFNSKEEIYEEIQALEGQLIIKEYPTKSAGVTTIRNHLEKLKQRKVPVDLIIVDYADLLRSKLKNNEKRHELESIYEELRAVAQEFDCPVWTASQTNRAGLNEEVITMQSISEAFSKCFVADFIFSISRTIEHKETNSGRVYIAKNRNGPDGMVHPIFMDTSNVKIKILPQVETCSEVQMNVVKKQADNLKKKYQKFRNETRENNA